LLVVGVVAEDTKVVVEVLVGIVLVQH